MRFPLASRSELEEASARAMELEERVGQLQSSVDILRADKLEARSYSGNPYPSYKSQVMELAKKFNGTAEWGNQVAGNVIAVRATFTVGGGLRAVSTEPGKGEKELDWLQAFIRHNDLDEDVPQSLATEANIEGKALIRLYPNMDTEQIDIRFIPWTEVAYEIKTPPDDYGTYVSAEYRLEGKSQPVVVPSTHFVYRAFGGRRHEVNLAPPICGSILRHMEALDKALVDWRKINHLFAAPTPVIVKPQTAVKTVMPTDDEGNVNWKLGKMLELPFGSDFKLVSMSGVAYESLHKEVSTNAQIISGRTGVPIHFLGFTELMSNRSTAETLVELVVAATRKDRDVWRSLYQDLFRKAMILSNEFFHTGLDPELVGAELPIISDAKVKQIAETWLPLYLAGAISLETLLEQVPEIDYVKEGDRLKDQASLGVGPTVHDLEEGGPRP